MKKYFEAPSAELISIMSADIITESATNPAPVYENQLDLWDMNMSIQS